MEGGSRRTKARSYKVELEIELWIKYFLYVKIESKSSAFGLKRKLRGGERIFFVSPLWLDGWA